MMTPKERAAVSIQNESETVSSLSTMRTAMQQALEALEMFAKHYSDGNEALTALREALAGDNMSPTEQAEQEPVAWVKFQNGEITHAELSDGSGSDMDLSDWTPLYAAPVRTKDLTDDEIMKINVDTASIVPTCDRQFHFARAVIAADREKNK